jgi:hypothetical protein
MFTERPACGDLGSTVLKTSFFVNSERQVSGKATTRPCANTLILNEGLGDLTTAEV